MMDESGYYENHNPGVPDDTPEDPPDDPMPEPPYMLDGLPVVHLTQTRLCFLLASAAILGAEMVRTIRRLFKRRGLNFDDAVWESTIQMAAANRAWPEVVPSLLQAASNGLEQAAREDGISTLPLRQLAHRVKTEHAATQEELAAYERRNNQPAQDYRPKSPVEKDSDAKPKPPDPKPDPKPTDQPTTLEDLLKNILKEGL